MNAPRRPKEQYKPSVSFALKVKVKLPDDGGVQFGRQIRTKIHHPNKVVTFFAPDCTFSKQTLAYHVQKGT
jgi:hypothetical protein